MKPWEELFVKLWDFCTKGRRRFLTIPLFLVFFAAPATVGLVETYQKANAFLKPILLPTPIVLSADEKDLLDQEEWGLIVASTASEADALRKRDEFKSIYAQSGHKNSQGQLIWINDILVVRDPREVGQWLVAIDMYPGPSSREALQQGVIEMIESERGTGVRGEPLQRWLNGSAPYRFTMAVFERTYGKVAR